MNFIRTRDRFLTALLISVTLNFGCQNTIFQPANSTPPAMREVSAVRLNYKYEADVPAPETEATRAPEERNPAVLADFDANRPLELLDRTIVSPDKKRIAAVYHRISDTQSDHRLDIYSVDGVLQKKVTSDMMAVHFPDTIVWSPDSNSFAFVAMIRTEQPDAIAGATIPTNTPPVPNENSNTLNSEVITQAETPAAAMQPTVVAPTGILTFRTEQIYICNADGSSVKPVTENEGLIYFYYAWSPDSSMLAALATTAREWKIAEITADSKSEMMVPLGRLRIVERNGRERRLDDNLTAVHPVWSPDSAKVAVAFETQLRIYDANGTNPTQAAIPLRNQLLISSQIYDREQQRQAQASNADANTSTTPDQPLSTLPDEKLLVSYNPIVGIAWPADDLIYLKTAYLKRMKNEADNVTSFARWHRLALLPQAAASPK
ncbi:MAG: TolB family protein [Pyrinomonadaceae bacterium]